MNYDDGNLIKEIKKSDIILLVLAELVKHLLPFIWLIRDLRHQIYLINENSLPQTLKDNPKVSCVIGLNTEPERLADIRKNRMNSLKETQNKSYTSLDEIKKEVEDAKKLLENINGL